MKTTTTNLSVNRQSRRLTYGSYKDNYSAYHIAKHKIGRGEVDLGKEILLDLRENILSSKEAKSYRWLLPEINASLAAMLAKQGKTKNQSTNDNALFRNMVARKKGQYMSISLQMF